MSTILYTDDNHQCIKFDGQTIGGEVQANQFLIKHDRRGMLIGCGGQRIYKSVLAELSSHLPAGALDYIFLSHQDPDICSGLNQWLPICKAQVMISSLWVRFLPAFCVQGLLESRVTAIPNSGMQVELAGSPLVAVPAHFLYSPGNLQLYDPVSKILFTGSLGSSLQSHIENIVSEEDFSRHQPSMTAFHNRHIAGNEACKRWAAMIRQLDVEMIVPQYGALISGKDLVEKFYQWVEQEKTAVDDFADGLFKLPGGAV
ncbi:MAG: FprA family A-type flavoprotein [Desulfobulbaceae bacterium]|nr:FprA family A-type flavoprotein [Desulfobulbaceae bacterium]